MNIGIIGLGIMGSAIARLLGQAGVEVAGFDVDRAGLEKLGEDGLSVKASAAEVAEVSDLILTSLPSATALEKMVYGGGGLLTAAKPGLIVAELSTLPIEVKEHCRGDLAAAGITLLDCPVSGTGAQAATGDLAVYASGDQDTLERVTPMLEKFSRAVYFLGEFGNGSKMKFVANLLVSINNVATAEAIVLGAKAGLDPERVCQVVAAGAGSSRIFELRGPLMARRQYKPATMKMEMWQKDLDVITAFASKLGAPTPLFDAAKPVYSEALAMGMGDEDVAAVCRVLEKMAGLRRR